MESAVQLNEAKPLPPGWQRVRLCETCEINPSRPKHFSRATDAITTFVPMEAVDERLGKISAPEIRPYSKISKGYTYFEERDVLFSKITPCMQNGKHAIARDLIDGIGFGTTEFHVLRPNSEILPEWIHFFIRQPYFLREAANYFTGAVGQQRVPESFIATYVIPLPPLAEQKRIVVKVQELTEEIERARTACETQLEAARALLSTYLRHVFESDEVKKWGRERLGNLCEFTKGKKPRTLYEKEQEGCLTYILIESFDGTHKKFSDDDICPKCIKDDVLLVWDGARSGLSTIGLEGYIGSTIVALRPKSELVSGYLFWVLQFHYEDLNRNVRGTGIPHLEKEHVYSLLIPLPPLTIQEYIATELTKKASQAEKLKGTVEKQLHTLKALPQAILGKAFSGEL